MTPEAIEWSEGLSVGDDSIDREHQDLIVCFRRLLDPARQDDGAYIRETLAELVEQVFRHFDHEEQIMRAITYPDYAQHKRAHDELVRQINNFVVLLKAEPDAWKGTSIIDFVGKWLVGHILEDDRRIGDHIRATRAPRR